MECRGIDLFNEVCSRDMAGIVAETGERVVHAGSNDVGEGQETGRIRKRRGRPSPSIGGFDGNLPNRLAQVRNCLFDLQVCYTIQSQYLARKTLFLAREPPKEMEQPNN